LTKKLKVGDIPQEERYQEITGYQLFRPSSETARTHTDRIRQKVIEEPIPISIYLIGASAGKTRPAYVWRHFPLIPFH
jgi:hypothetical protein